jgi:ATP-dependent protease ClpP protease subunit
MQSEVLIYGVIDAECAGEFFECVNESIESTGTEDITLRVNSDGGEVRYGWGIVAKYSELTGKKVVKNDGAANSMAAFLFCYADDSECVDVATFGFHRAAYPTWYESNPELFTDFEKQHLARVNASLRKAMESKIDVVEFEKITGITMNQLFSMDSRVEVVLTAKQAKQCKLVNKVIPITPKKRMEIAALFENKQPVMANMPTTEKPLNNNSIKKTMNATQLKSEHFDVYNEIFNAGVLTERDRVEACLTFIAADQPGVISAIKEGKQLSAKQMAEFTLKSVAAANVEKIENGAAPVLNAGEIAIKAETEKQKEISAFVAEVKKNSLTIK